MRSVIARSTRFKCDRCKVAFSACATLDDNWVVKCPHCGHEHHCPPGDSRKPEGAEIHKGNPNFYGKQRFSLASGCHPSEVPLYKKIMGPDFESCILDDGTVKFKNAQQQAKFVEHFQRMRAVNWADHGCFDRKGPRPEAAERA